MIKKINALLSLITCVLLIIHTCYETAAYILFVYNPVMTKITGLSLEAAFVLHAILSVISVLIKHDSKTIAYKRLNISTTVQRISAAFMVVLLPCHITFSALLFGQTATKAKCYLFLAFQILFYAAIFTHVAVSFSKALITLGILEDERVMKNIDRAVVIVCVVLFAAVGYGIIATQMAMIAQL